MPNTPPTSRPEAPTQDRSAPARAPNQISSFRPGQPPGGAEVFTTVLLDPWRLDELLIRAGTAPADGDFSFDIERAGSVERSVTLPQGETEAAVSLEISVGAGERVRVLAQSTEDSGLEDVTCAFSLEVP